MADFVGYALDGGGMMAILAAERSTSLETGKKFCLAEIVREKSLIRGSGIQLASGAESDFYFDMKPTLFDPEGSNLIADLILDAIAGLKVDFIAGLEMGAVPVVTSVCQKSFRGDRIPGFFVRKQAKDHGTKRRIEGIPPNVELKGKHVLFVDDVTTSSYARKLVTGLSGGVFGYLDSVLERHSFDEFGELI